MAIEPPYENQVIHRAKWVVPVSSPPFGNGAVLVRASRIVSFGGFADIKKECPTGTPVIDHGTAALFPALVNAHTHLELSAFKGAMAFPYSGFPEWIGRLYSIRAAIEKNAMEEGFFDGQRELLDSGTALCGDVTNCGIIQEPCRDGVTRYKNPSRPPLEKGEESKDFSDGARLLERQVFLELLGFNLSSIAAAMPPGIDPASVGSSLALVPHSVYSVSPHIIAEAKQWTRARGLPFSIHAAEHPEEMEFLRTGAGFCREFLQKLGRWDPAWVPPGKTPVEYLDMLGVLDPGTILVHAVHMLGSDWALAACGRCTVVFCPRSNRNIGAGRPEIENALSCGIRAALGTDSLASNTDLDLFAEAAFVLDHYPAVRPDLVLEMLTINPATALGRRGIFGSIERGGKADLLAVSIQPDINESSIAESLIRSGTEGAWKWVNPAQV